MIDIRNLSFTYPDGTEVLRDITLHIGTGDRVAIVGPSGAGKSTFMKCINRLLNPQVGSVKIDGEEMVGMSEKLARRKRQKVAMIFQHYNLINRITAVENVLLGRLAHIPLWRRYLYGFNYSHYDHQIALESLEQVQIGSLAEKRVDQLSGGQQQRVGIARALAQKPNCFLADEPVSNLDLKIKKEILELVVSLCEYINATLVICMHEVDLARRYVQHIYGLSNGKLVFDGPVEEFTESVIETIYT